MATPKEIKKTLAAFARIEGTMIRHGPSYHMKQLAERLAYLEKKVAEHDASDAAMNHHRSERNALRWAIDKLTAVLTSERAAREKASDLLEP